MRVEHVVSAMSILGRNVPEIFEIIIDGAETITDSVLDPSRFNGSDKGPRRRVCEMRGDKSCARPLYATFCPVPPHLRVEVAPRRVRLPLQRNKLSTYGAYRPSASLHNLAKER